MQVENPVISISSVTSQTAHISKIKEPMINSGRIKLEPKVIKIKARNAGNSKTIAKFRNAEIDDFRPRLVVHELIRGSLNNKRVAKLRDRH